MGSHLGAIPQPISQGSVSGLEWRRVWDALLLFDGQRNLWFWSVRKRPMAMMCSALLAARSPPRLSRYLTVFPDDAGTGLTPYSDAKLASDLDLSGLSPAVMRSCAAPMWPIELRATRFAASSSTMAAVRSGLLQVAALSTMELWALSLANGLRRTLVYPHKSQWPPD